MLTAYLTSYDMAEINTAKMDEVNWRTQGVCPRESSQTTDEIYNEHEFHEYHEFKILQLWKDYQLSHLSAQGLVSVLWWKRDDYYGELCEVHPGTCLIAMSDERGKRDEG
jgi:hypothetical protein